MTVKTGKLVYAVILSSILGACGDDDDPAMVADGGASDGPAATGDGPGGGSPGGDGGSGDAGGGDAPISAITNARTQVGATGGRVASADGRLVIEIPEDAIIASVPIRITTAANAGAGALGAAYDVSPPLKLGKPARVFIRYSAGDIGGGGQASDLRVATFAGNHWIPLEKGSLDLAGTRVSGEASQLGRFALVPGVCQVCTTTCNPATCKFGVSPTSTGVEGRCATYGMNCSRCVPNCDGDGDGYCPGRPGNDQPGGDCQDADPGMSPGATELCGNNKDDDCDGYVDEGCSACRSDNDCNVGLQACVNGVCDVCETGCKLENCTFGKTDTLPGVQGRCHMFGKGCSKCVPDCDKDGDGFCPMAVPGNMQPGGDCDDTNGGVNPKASETCGNNLDDDCDGHVDEGCVACKADAECPLDRQVCSGGVCDKCENTCDANNCRFKNNEMDPGTPGKCVTYGKGCSKCIPTCDGDQDGYCPGAGVGGRTGGDCKDNDAKINPGAGEACGNDVDDDCDGQIDEGCKACKNDDECTQGNQACIDGLCDVCAAGCDAQSCRFGVMKDMPMSGVPGRCHAFGKGCNKCVPACDMDGDGFCPAQPGNEQPGGDCDDMNAAANPKAVEICGNTVDDDCDGRADEACATCGMSMTCGAQELCSTNR